MLGTSGPTAADPLPLALDRRTGRRTDLAESCSAPLGPSNHRVTSHGIAVGLRVGDMPCSSIEQALNRLFDRA
jgi:hypothetical protein